MTLKLKKEKELIILDEALLIKNIKYPLSNLELLTVRNSKLYFYAGCTCWAVSVFGRILNYPFAGSQFWAFLMIGGGFTLILTTISVFLLYRLFPIYAIEIKEKTSQRLYKLTITKQDKVALETKLACVYD